MSPEDNSLRGKLLANWDGNQENVHNKGQNEL